MARFHAITLVSSGLVALALVGCQPGQAAQAAAAPDRAATPDEVGGTVPATQDAPPRAALPVKAPVPDFSLQRQDGQPVTLARMRGQVWLASFIFTRCTTICPLISEKLKKLEQRSLREAGALKLVSISVDPDHDTPEVLSAYGKKFGVDFDRWQFWTGERAQVQKLVTDGFKQLIIPAPSAPGGPPDILHGGALVLVDQAGKVRASYESHEVELDLLLKDVRSLL